VHADIKAENILVDEHSEGFAVKVIDYGSHCLFSNLRMLNMTTPEYTAP
jgi:serine/threonine protein kinase